MRSWTHRGTEMADDVLTLETIAELRRLWAKWKRLRDETDRIPDPPIGPKWWSREYTLARAVEDQAYDAMLEATRFRLPALLDLAEKALRAGVTPSMDSPNDHPLPSRFGDLISALPPIIVCDPVPLRAGVGRLTPDGKWVPQPGDGEPINLTVHRPPSMDADPPTVVGG